MSVQWRVMSVRLHFAHPGNCTEDSTPKQHRDHRATHSTHAYALVGSMFAAPDDAVFLRSAGGVDRRDRLVGVGGGACDDMGGSDVPKATCPNTSGCAPGVDRSTKHAPPRASVMARSGKMSRSSLIRGFRYGSAALDSPAVSLTFSAVPNSRTAVACGTGSGGRSGQTRKIGRG